ncbi:MAG TPA: hypothetical protein VM285_09240 [Polyangia bacterium]|nr:hypothetical protein [Polyangia bacterium]
MKRGFAIAAFLAATLPTIGCASQMIVRGMEDAETGETIACTGSDWGGNGLPHGYWICLWPDGSTHSTGQYLEGVKIGRWEYHDRAGRLSHVELWRDGDVVLSEFGDAHAEGEGLSGDQELGAVGD